MFSISSALVKYGSRVGVREERQVRQCVEYVEYGEREREGQRERERERERERVCARRDKCVSASNTEKAFCIPIKH